MNKRWTDLGKEKRMETKTGRVRGVREKEAWVVDHLIKKSSNFVPKSNGIFSNFPEYPFGNFLFLHSEWNSGNFLTSC